MRIPTLSVDEAHERYSNGMPIIDVREAHEWDAQHIPNSIHLPLSTFVDRAQEIPDSKEVGILCSVGGRSAEVTKWLLSKGVTAYNIQGGLSAWGAAGYAVEN